MTNQNNNFYGRIPLTNQQYVDPQIASGGVNNMTNTGTASLSRNQNQGSLPGIRGGYKIPAQNYASGTLQNLGMGAAENLKTSMIYTQSTLDYQSEPSAQLEPNRNPVKNRLQNSGLSRGADPYTTVENLSDKVDRRYGETDDRVYLKDYTGYFTSGVAGALAETGGLLWPFTPTINSGHRANYDMQRLTHTPYAVPVYQNSGVDSITVSGEFTASNEKTAAYVAGAIWFLRSVTKMFYGNDGLAGTPPPVLFLTGHGPVIFENVPVVVTSFDLSLPADVDYISCTVGGNHQRVPTLVTLSATMTPTYSRNKLTNSYSLESIASGQLIGQGFI